AVAGAGLVGGVAHGIRLVDVCEAAVVAQAHAQAVLELVAQAKEVAKIDAVVAVGVRGAHSLSASKATRAEKQKAK
nr:hypothetical protein [Tanacetum cinerariifolium]